MKVIPVIKLAKAIISNLPEKLQISGYHAEALAVKAFNKYSGDYQLGAMLRHYFTQASRYVKRPISDETGQSYHLDDDLGANNSLERRMRSDAFSRIVRKMNTADAAKNIDILTDLF